MIGSEPTHAPTRARGFFEAAHDWLSGRSELLTTWVKQAAMIDRQWVVMFANYAGLAANGITLLITARQLGSAGRGAYSALLTWQALAVATSGFSIGQAVARGVASGQDMNYIRRFLCRGWLLTAASGIALMLLFLHTVLGRVAIDSLTQAAVLSVIPASIASEWAAYLFQGAGSLILYVTARVLPTTITCVSVLCLSFFGLNVTTALLVVALGYWLTLGLVLVPIARHPGFPGGAGATQGGLIRFAGRTHVGTLCAVANARLDSLIVSALLPLSSVGNYSLATSLTVPIALIGGSIGAAAYRQVGVGGMDAVSTAWRRFVWPSALLTVGALLISLALPRVMGAQYAAARFPMVILAIGSSGFGAIYLGTSILQARGKAARSSLVYFAAALTSAGGLALTVPRYGIVGAALSSTIAYIAGGVLAYRLANDKASCASP